jgi:hypothetical protein
MSWRDETPEPVHDDLDRLADRALSAAAFVAPVESQEGDAVRVELEHRDGGPALELLLPYRGADRRGSLELGELTAAAGDRRVWL